MVDQTENAVPAPAEKRDRAVISNCDSNSKPGELTSALSSASTAATLSTAGTLQSSPELSASATASEGNDVKAFSTSDGPTGSGSPSAKRVKFEVGGEKENQNDNVGDVVLKKQSERTVGSNPFRKDEPELSLPLFSRSSGATNANQQHVSPHSARSGEKSGSNSQTSGEKSGSNSHTPGQDLAHVTGTTGATATSARDAANNLARAASQQPNNAVDYGDCVPSDTCVPGADAAGWSEQYGTFVPSAAASERSFRRALSEAGSCAQLIDAHAASAQQDAVSRKNSRIEAMNPDLTFTDLKQETGKGRDAVVEILGVKGEWGAYGGTGMVDDAKAQGEGEGKEDEELYIPPWDIDRGATPTNNNDAQAAAAQAQSRERAAEDAFMENLLRTASGNAAQATIAIGGIGNGDAAATASVAAATETPLLDTLVGDMQQEQKQAEAAMMQQLLNDTNSDEHCNVLRQLVIGA